MLLRSELSFIPVQIKILMILFVLLSMHTGPFTKQLSANGDVKIKLYMQQELNTLPDYCQYRLAESEFREEFKGINGKTNWPPIFKETLNKWRGKIGIQNWTHIHHYCFGIRHFQNYSLNSSNKNETYKKHELTRALENFEYIRKAKTLNFPFWYDLYRYEAYLHLRLGNTAKAKWALKNSLKYKRK